MGSSSLPLAAGLRTTTEFPTRASVIQQPTTTYKRRHQPHTHLLRLFQRRRLPASNSCRQPQPAEGCSDDDMATPAGRRGLRALHAGVAFVGRRHNATTHTHTHRTASDNAHKNTREKCTCKSCGGLLFEEVYAHSIKCESPSQLSLYVRLACQEVYRLEAGGRSTKLNNKSSNVQTRNEESTRRKMYRND